ncbi:RNA polymerase sigma factor [Actinomycetospora rhizophila]|uniref:RNA polymerase sigma factor n=1 Tax=Actinomycetospora rhizophila TaxID=1416876 RepID=A0ABV9ZF60_9PSEU
MLSTPPPAAADVTLVPTDRFLVDRARDGDREAHAALVRRHRQRIYRVALQVLGCPADADDVTQDVVIHLATALARFDGTASFTTWLHRVVVNRSLNHRRAHPSTSEITEHTHPHSRGPEHAVVTAAEVTAGLRAIAALPDELRAPLVLIQLEGMSYREAAAVTGVSEATVRGRLARARCRLAAAMADWTPVPAVPRPARHAG